MFIRASCAAAWDPSDSACGCPAWRITAEHSVIFYAPAEGLPMGAAPWNEWCDGAWDYSGTVSLAAAAGDGVAVSSSG